MGKRKMGPGRGCARRSQPLPPGSRAPARRYRSGAVLTMPEKLSSEKAQDNYPVRGTHPQPGSPGGWSRAALSRLGGPASCPADSCCHSAPGAGPRMRPSSDFGSWRGRRSRPPGPG